MAAPGAEQAVVFPREVPAAISQPGYPTRTDARKLSTSNFSFSDCDDNPFDASSSAAAVWRARDLPPLRWSSLKYGFGWRIRSMARKRHTTEEIVAKLRQVDVLKRVERNLAMRGAESPRQTT
jgi:hypothetical protein